jgi:putative aldouronate transport system substrate-binding protein
MAKDGLFETYGADIPTQLPEWILAGCYVGDGLYALPSVKDFAISVSICCIAAKYLDGIGYDYDSKWSDPNKESIKVDKWEDLDPIFEQLHAKYPDVAIFTSTGSLNQGYVYDNVGADWYGVLLDPVNSLKVSDVWSSQEFKDITTRTHRYNQLGYVYANALTERVGMGTAIASGVGMTVVSQGKPGYKTQATSESSGNLVIPFQIGPDIVKSTAPTNVCYCMNSSCEDPIATMQFLNLAYTDSYISNLLCWGEEGVEYQVLDNGTIDYCDGVTRDTCEYATDVQWEMPNELLAHPWHTDTPDLWERMRAFNENAGRSLALGFNWDNADYATQFTALENVRTEYESPLILGFYDPQEKIPEMVERLKGVGLDDYIAAKTAALTEWATEKGLADKL